MEGQKVELTTDGLGGSCCVGSDEAEAAAEGVVGNVGTASLSSPRDDQAVVAGRLNTVGSVAATD